MRYGDDFLLFARTQSEALRFQGDAAAWLRKNLRLKLHTKNNVIIQPKCGVHILGHWTYPKYQLIVDKTMKRKISRDLTVSNAATYKSMRVPKRMRHQMSHRLTPKTLSNKRSTKR
jgi:hypothetical protein